MKRPGDFFQKGIDYLSAALLGTVIILVVFFSNVPRYISKSFLLPNGTLVLIAVGGWLLFVGACRFISEKRHLRLSSDEEGGEKQHMVDRAVVGLCVCLFFVQLYICYNIFFVTGWDPGTIWATALARVEGEVWNEMYFSRYPNNLLLLLLETALIRIHNMVGILPKEYAGFSPAEKLDQLRSKLKELGCTAQFVGKLDNLAWLLNLRAMDIECTPYAMAYCYVTPSRAVLFINTARVTPEAKAELEANGITLAEYDDVLEFLAAETEPQTVLAECSTVNYAVYQVLEQNPALTVKDGTDPLLLMKGVKNETELAHTKQAHIRDAVAMVRFQMELESRLAAGETLTELTVDEILHKYRSADDKFLVESFGTIAAYGGNAAMMHYHATPEDHAVLEKKGFLLVDSGATYMDGTTDITRTYPLGPLTEDEKRFYTWTLQSHIDLAKAVWLDYCECKMIDTIAREPLWRHLINYRCGTGHSVSFVGNVHEGPHALNSRNTTRMRPGMVVTDEPGVYETDLVGIRIENELVCIHKADNQYGTFLGFEPLTFVPIATSPILPGVLDKDELAWLNDYHRQVFAKLAPHLNAEERVWLAEKCASIGC